ncbi:glycoside hydrolase family 88 protein [Alkalihalobacillus oceani]|uniref:glycoside hydrolase family 88 protein n=1 Tax=Halalkalibacter oceani TaxID=1653776 RepID=UPI0020425FCC|nr:glycoside hydrolase family 88 protein [Halalkalibacter oceani]MCM3761327.1 glycoside hydrolase family 88 protein [Halalkalibacter oceani]
MTNNLADVLMKSLEKVTEIEKKVSDFPHITKDGKWLTFRYGHWTGGFWTGLQWIKSLYETDQQAALQQAAAWARRLKARTADNKTHDMGFLFGPSCVMGERLTGDGQLKELAIAGAYNMSDLYEERAGLILAWDEPGYEGVAIVDTIMNLPLMVWASQDTGNEKLAQTAIQVADNIIRYHVRADASTYHTVRWDTESFAVVEQGTHQGFSAETCWSRGQAWALYGFANMYRYTGEKRYLDCSARLADYFWDHLDDGTTLPRWDFYFRNEPDAPIDSSAASIAAAGMLLLADQSPAEQEARWHKRGELLVQALIDHCFSPRSDCYGLIERATVDQPRRSGVGESTMYGDYYFVEALYRLIYKNDHERLALFY